VRCVSRNLPVEGLFLFCQGELETSRSLLVEPVSSVVSVLSVLLVDFYQYNKLSIFAPPKIRLAQKHTGTTDPPNGSPNPGIYFKTSRNLPVRPAWSGRAGGWVFTFSD
jgi:hypothetical protein